MRALRIFGVALLGLPASFAVAQPTGPHLATVNTFTGFPDAANPFATLIAGKNGTLFGTSYNGGQFDAGSVFELLIRDGEITQFFWRRTGFEMRR